MGLKTDIKEELKHFCKTTSMKGLTRAFNAKYKIVAIAWGFFIGLLLALALYQVSDLVLDYTSYPSYTVTEEEQFNAKDNLPTLPTFTLCNENSVGHNDTRLQENNYMSLEEYYNALENALNCPNCSNTEQLQLQILKGLLKSPQGYFQTIGHKAAQLSGNQQEEFIIDCNEILYFGTKFIERPCTDLIRIRLFQSIDYFNCYSIIVPHTYDTEKYGIVAGVSLVMYLNNVLPLANSSKESLEESVKQELKVRSNGVTATPHHSEGTPFVSLDSIYLNPGTSTKFQLYVKNKERLEPPHGKCVPSNVKGFEYLKMCISECYHKDIIKQCGCVFSYLEGYMDEPEVPFCIRFDQQNPQKALQDYQCASSLITIDRTSQCLAQCPQVCFEYDFRSETSRALWPSPSSIEAFYNRFIKDASYKEHFESVRKLIDGNCTDEVDCQMTYILSRFLLSDNFIEFKFHLNDIRYAKVKEYPKITIADFCSKLGGILNLWSGITVILLLELIEVIVKVIHKSIYKNKVHPATEISVKESDEKTDNVENNKQNLDNLKTM